MLLGRRNDMYQINELIVYGNSGVCRVLEIGVPDIAGIDKNKKYYILTPIYSKGSLIYTPVETSKIPMRRVITMDKAQELLESIPSIPTINIGNEKFAEEKYRSAISTQDCKELIKVIKTVYLRQQDKISEGKKLSQTDERYFKQAEDLLYGEIAIVLNMPREKMKTYIELRTMQIEQK